MDDEDIHECLRAHYDNPCQGEVTARASFGGTGALIYECVKHMDESYERNNEHCRNYPDSDIPPAWFDPTYAGERWNDDY